MRIHRTRNRMRAWILLLAAWIGGCIPARENASAQIRPVHPGTRLLKSDGLAVEVDDPAAPAHNLFNRGGRRFSPVAMVLRARYNGKEFFYSPVDGGAYKHVGGAPMEFDLGENAMNKPPGFEEAEAGAGDGKGNFLKVGVGILRKDNEVYGWGHDYPEVEPAMTQTVWDPKGDKAVFLQTLRGTANGYACELEVMLLLRDNQMIFEYGLKNTGRKPFITEQYVHNFLAFSEMPPGPGTEVRLPYDFQLSGDPGPAIRRRPGGNVLEFLEPPPKAVKFRITAPPGYPGSNELTVVYRAANQSLTINASLPSNAVDLWCTDRQISPEMLVLVSLGPGEEKRWTRTYTFSDVAE
jgi:hypothetical protein